MLNQAEITTIIRSIPWFLELSPENVQSLTAIAEVVSFDKDQVIFSEGEKHPYLYVILEGKVCVESYVPVYGSMPVFTAESLDVIGWSSMTPVVRQKTGTARVLESTRLLSFKADELLPLCEKNCDLGFIIMCRLANVVASRLLTHRLHLLELLSTHDK